MKYLKLKSPFKLGTLKYKHITQSIQLSLLIVLIASFFIYNRAGYQGVNILLNAIIAIVVSFIVEVLFAVTAKKFTTIKDLYFKENLLMIPLLTVLLLPLHTPIFVIIIATIVGVWIGKLVFGGYGFSIFNPAIVGVLFANLSFKSQLAMPDGIIYPLQRLKDATANLSIAGLNPHHLLLVDGGYGMAIGTASVGLLILLIVVLSIIRAIDWRISLTYLVTVFGITFVMGKFFFAQEQILTGLVIFGALFLVTDDVTSPTSRETKIVYAVIVGLLTVMIRTIGSNLEGVLFAVLLGNLITPFLNRTVKRSNLISLAKALVFAVIVIVAAGAALNAILEGRIPSELTTIMGVMI
ncbi:RnfABCDGE type electron transport complex subunit D [Mycoplasmatota bacterium]|nr:RnfABCDGE type electron transport complex subunit D [Mycoplasmatota bacterium]